MVSQEVQAGGDGLMAAVLVERDAAMAAVRALISDALAGRGGALFVAGEAGLGKTAVLDYAVAAAEGRLKVGVGRADVAEAALPFGLAGQALDAVLGGPAGAGERGSAPAPADYFYAVLAALRRAAADGPVFLALDDAHWADPDSLTLLRLICRRIGALPVAVLVTTRPWPPEALRAADELAAQQLAAVQPLAPLSGEAARSLLRQRSGADGADLDDGADLCAGNPLLLDRLAAALRAGARVPASAAGTSWSRRLLLSHLAGLDEPTLRYLRAAAVLGRRFRPDVAAQVAGLGAAEAAAAQEAFTSAGLGSVAGPGEAEFGHELVRQAIYELAAPVRAGLHEAAFRALAARGASAAEAAGHAVAAGLTGDAAAVAVVTRAGREALAAGAVAAARRHLQAAAGLSPSPVPADLVADLARALIADGDHAAGVARYTELLTRPGLAEDLRLTTLLQLSHAQFAAGQTSEAGAAVEEALRLAGPARRDLAAGALADHAAQVLVSQGWDRAEALAVRARELAAGASTAVRAAADGVWAVGAYFAGDPAGLEVGQAAARAAATVPAWRLPGAPWWDTVAQYAAVALSAERFDEARRLLDQIIEAAERRSDPLGMAIALLFRARVSWRLGRLAEALALSDRLTDYTDLVPVISPLAFGDRAAILLDLGRLDEAAGWSARADEAIGRGSGLGYAVMPAHLPRGTLALRRGDSAAAAATFTRMWQTADALKVLDPGTVAWAGEAIAAYLACGRDADVRRLLDWLAPAVGALPSRWPAMIVAAAEAALAERADDAGLARERYDEALAIARGLPIPLARAQVLTDYGRFARRQGDAGAARRMLGEAAALAEGCGAAWHAGQARAEWRRAGGRSGTTPPGQLTPQEAAVARLAKAGLTNREIAGQLYLTVNTVETHLRHVYRKLGIHRRAELMTLPDTAPQPPG